MIEALEASSSKRKNHGDADKIAVLTAWHRVDCRTREAFRHSFLPELVNNYEVYFISYEKKISVSNAIIANSINNISSIGMH